MYLKIQLLKIYIIIFKCNLSYIHNWIEFFLSTYNNIKFKKEKNY
jgi:hypothetical protein